MMIYAVIVTIAAVVTALGWYNERLRFKELENVWWELHAVTSLFVAKGLSIHFKLGWSEGDEQHLTRAKEHAITAGVEPSQLESMETSIVGGVNAWVR
jgi:hypothetical protein